MVQFYLRTSYTTYLAKWLTFKLFGITYLRGKIKFKLLFQGPLAKWDKQIANHVMRWSFLLIVFSTRTLANFGGPKWQCFFQSNDILWDTNHECHESTMTHETHVLRWWRANSAPLGTVENNFWQSLYTHLGGGFNVFLIFTLIWGRWTYFDFRIFFKGVEIHQSGYGEVGLVDVGWLYGEGWWDTLSENKMFPVNIYICTWLYIYNHFYLHSCKIIHSFWGRSSCTLYMCVLGWLAMGLLLGEFGIHILGQGQPQLRVRNMLGQDVAW